MSLSSHVASQPNHDQQSQASIELTARRRELTDELDVSTDSAGQLCIDLAAVLGHPCQVRISGWADGIQCASHLSDEIMLLDPFDEVGFTLSMLCQQCGAQGWMDALPAKVAADLLRLERLYYNSQFAALWLMSRSPGAVELFLSAPVLFYVLLEGGRSGRFSAEKLLTLVYEKRTFLLGVCGLPDSRALLRLLQELPANKLYPHDLVVIRQFLSVTAWERINHQRYIDLQLLRCLIARPALLGSRLLNGYGPGWSWPQFISLCDDILRVSRRLGQSDGYQRIIRCGNLRELNRLHDRLVIELNKIVFTERENIVFSTPPLQGNESIQPICDARALREEGAAQRHCIASYLHEILSGRYYAYRIFAPERATLGIAIDELGTPSVAQLKLRFNGTPGEETQSAIREWLAVEMRERRNI